RLCAHRCSTAVTNSSSVAEDLRSLCTRGLRIEAVHNGIDTTAFAPEGPSLDLDAIAGLAPMDKRGVRVGLLGTFARWKGHETFLRALASVDPSISIRGYVIGASIYQSDGSQHSVEELKNVGRALGLEGRVGFTGYLDDSAAAIRSLDIVVHASTQPEPFGMVIIEAMACGKPVIVSGCGGASEIVEDRVNALTHEPGDVVALAARIQELAMSAKLRIVLRRAAKFRARSCGRCDTLDRRCSRQQAPDGSASAEQFAEVAGKRRLGRIALSFGMVLRRVRIGCASPRPEGRRLGTRHI